MKWSTSRNTANIIQVCFREPAFVLLHGDVNDYNWIKSISLCFCFRLCPACRCTFRPLQQNTRQRRTNANHSNWPRLATACWIGSLLSWQIAKNDDNTAKNRKVSVFSTWALKVIRKYVPSDGDATETGRSEWPEGSVIEVQEVRCIRRWIYLFSNLSMRLNSQYYDGSHKCYVHKHNNYFHYFKSIDIIVSWSKNCFEAHSTTHNSPVSKV